LLMRSDVGTEARHAGFHLSAPNKQGFLRISRRAWDAGRLRI
jgi:hypothetical protein